MTDKSMAPIPAEKIADLAAVLGHDFANPQLLALALQHRSVSAEHNQRLEFLGDALLGAIIAGDLYRLYPSWDEGRLTRARALLVKQSTLVEIAQQFKLHAYLQVSVAERAQHAECRPSLLADGVEAIVAAIYLDSSFADCQACVLRWYAPYFERLPQDTNLKDAKSSLQEHLQRIAKPLPKYTVLRVTGLEHAQLFTVQCELPHLALSTQGQGSTKRLAQQAAAANMLQQLNR